MTVFGSGARVTDKKVEGKKGGGGCSDRIHGGKGSRRNKKEGRGAVTGTRGRVLET
jgi:hypothetical protein